MTRPLIEQMAVMYATEIEQLQQQLLLATEMRAAQRKYFITRNRSDLIAAKELERKFDIAAAGGKSVEMTPAEQKVQPDQ